MKTKFSGILTLFLAFVVQLSFAQEKTISGTISDENGLPLPGVNVIVKGTTNGTQTDFDGNYSIGANQGDVLSYSFVGYTTKEMAVGASNTISFAMEPNVEAIDEVVITAFNVERTADQITTSNQVVDADEITKANNPNVVQSLAGKVSGLQINTTNYGVDQDTRIVFRGPRSITGNNEALVVVDGVIQSANFLSNLNPELIESVNAIKGANGAALYGSRGANGVLIVTTKKGAEGSKMRVNINTSTQFESVAYLPERQTLYGQGWDGNHYTYENGGWGPRYDGSLQPVGLPDYDGNFTVRPYAPIEDNVKDFFTNGTTFQNSVAISGGTATSSTSLFVGNQRTEFVIPGDELNRTTVNFKANKKLGKLTIGGNASYVTRSTNTTSNALYGELLHTPGNVDVNDFSTGDNNLHWNGYFNSPYWYLNNQRSDNDTNRFNGIGEIKYDVNDNINVVYRISGTLTETTGESYRNGFTDVIQFSGSDRSILSSYATSKSSSRSIYSDLLVNFDYDLSDDFSLQVLLGNNITDNMSSSVSHSDTDLTIAGFYNAQNYTGVPTTGNSKARSRTIGLFGQVDLGYKDFLFLSATGRNDWTSRLHKDNRSFFYPSVGLSFVPTKAFPSIKGDVLGYAKVSANYVQVGNANVGTYATDVVGVQAGGYSYGDLNSFVINPSITDPMIENEYINSLEFNLDLEFFKRRLTLSGSYYNTENKNQIIGVQGSSASGVSNLTQNIGKTSSEGFEVDLGFTPIRTDNFEWTNNLSFTTYETKVDELADGVNSLALTNSVAGMAIFAEVGQPFPVIKATSYERDPYGRVLIDTDSPYNAPRTTSEFVNPQKTTPDYIINYNTSFSYKGFTLSAVMDYRTGHVFGSLTARELTWSGHAPVTAQNGRQPFIFPNSAIEVSPGVYEANNSYTTGGNTMADYVNYFSGDYADVGENNIFDATAFKVRELSLTYEFPSKILSNTKIDRLSVGVIARNPITVFPDENIGIDPEVNFSTGNAQGISNTAQYPSTRSFGFNVNLTF
ncbi:SusC/RagA family TonB-linked outer membrane protein [Mangrovimonas cancribranchiae]|uniref:SusC/RagA family TonB-linked outer membrane protein n=1 Tax=Mangrovimonas cancribranchiae TaxID=3080055 RepID=A0AAU6P213_9FLAO